MQANAHCDRGGEGSNQQFSRLGLRRILLTRDRHLLRAHTISSHGSKDIFQFVPEGLQLPAGGLARRIEATLKSVPEGR